MTTVRHGVIKMKETFDIFAGTPEKIMMWIGASKEASNARGRMGVSRDRLNFTPGEIVINSSTAKANKGASKVVFCPFLFAGNL
jgi:hypothetical protein